ncbi:MAG: hypothetical protein HY689_14515 [Chloroflexi bacterium]|nr:hypothetical protein [Chloroflexota bacterium]
MDATAIRDLKIKILVVWLILLPVPGAWYSLDLAAEPLDMTMVPHVPQPGAATTVTSTIENLAGYDHPTTYWFYVDGALLAEGVASLSSVETKRLQYLHRPPAAYGDRASFALRTETGDREHMHVLATVPYPPEVWSSFVSFASFSTTVMSSMITKATTAAPSARATP